ncbi:DNA topology modulation protein FlaR [Paenibacillus filicis]|uniref:DNA topology modulation protein FlaR n=1 Tax=Paenibacillus filicis TaxID=669464 RepID=A0ABU9DMJ7_9BACL
MARCPGKIHIIGSVGSGKTWLAGQAAERLSLPHYQTDNMVWMRTARADIRNPDEIRSAILQSVLSQKKWIIEGVHHRWLSESFRQADVIIYLDPPASKRRNRIISRFFRQRLGLETGNYKQSLWDLLQLLRWNREFDGQSRPDIMSLLQPYEHKLIVLDDSSGLEPYLTEWTAQAEVRLEAAGD